MKTTDTKRMWRGALRTEAEIVELERLRALAFPDVVAGEAALDSVKAVAATLVDAVPTRAEKMFAFITANALAGKTVYLQTSARTTIIRKKHLPQVRVNGRALEIQHGKRWLDYTYVDKVSAQ